MWESCRSEAPSGPDGGAQDRGSWMGSASDDQRRSRASGRYFYRVSIHSFSSLRADGGPRR